MRRVENDKGYKKITTGRKIIEFANWLFYVLYTCAAFMFVYIFTVFRAFRTMEIKPSAFLFGAVSIVSWGVCFRIYGKDDRRNWLTVILTSSGPFMIYTAFAYADTFPKAIEKAVILSIVSAVLLCIYLCRNGIRHRKYRCFFIAHTMFTAVMLALTIQLVFSRLLRDNLITANESSIVGTDSSEYTIENNIDSVIKLRDNEFSRLSASEKLDLLQIIVNIECQELGLSQPLKIGASNIGSKGEEITKNGFYADTYGSITIDLQRLETEKVSPVLQTVLHECFHAYQLELVELYEKLSPEQQKLLIFEDVVQYPKESLAYIASDSKESFDQYYSQLFEERARNYAAVRCVKYMVYIQDYLEKGVIKDNLSASDIDVKI